MKTMEARKEVFRSEIPDMQEVSARLDTLRGEPVDIINWKEFQYKPVVKFTVAYTDNEILLKYYVKEKYFKAEKTVDNEMVCEDSCVEFFVSPESDGIYYNFEFNAIGTCLLGTGTGRKDSSHAPAGVIDSIRRLTSAGTKPIKEMKGDFIWTLTLAIPTSVFFRHNIKDLKGRIFRANFYKCGDMLSEPHYLTWNIVGTPAPDYHQPEYFGQLKFI